MSTSSLQGFPWQNKREIFSLYAKKCQVLQKSSPSPSIVIDRLYPGSLCFLNASQKGLVNQGSSSIPPISLSFLLKTIGGELEWHPIHRDNHVNVSIKTCITSLVAKRSSQLTHTMVFLNLSKSTVPLKDKRTIKRVAN